jgi:hypothetical protein
MLSPVMDLDASDYEYRSEIAKYRYGFSFNSICITPNLVDTGAAQGTVDMNYYLASDMDVQNAVTMLRENTDADMMYADAK